MFILKLMNIIAMHLVYFMEDGTETLVEKDLKM